jgi:hypothetical protein
MTGEVIELIGTTTTLSTSGMTDFIEEIKVWAAEFWGCYIPNANEQMNVL